MGKAIRNNLGRFSKGCKINKGRKFSKEHIENLRKSHIGYVMPQTQKDKISKSNKGNPKTRGHRNHRWRGGKVVDGGGYVLIYSPHHPNAVHAYVREHRLVAEKYLQRFLKKSEHVHHIDFGRKNNKPENLFVFKTMGEHSRYHRLHESKNPLCKELKSNIV